MQHRERSAKLRGGQGLWIGFCALTAATAISGCGSVPKIVTADELCKDWRRQTVSKRDALTEGTASQIEANNKSRVVWGCHPKRNRAAS